MSHSADPARPCSKCGENPRHVRRSGVVDYWCSACKNAYQRAYFSTDAGKAALKRYWASAKGQQARRRANERIAKRRREQRQGRTEMAACAA
jgi:hypothetical protein